MKTRNKQTLPADKRRLLHILPFMLLCALLLAATDLPLRARIDGKAAVGGTAVVSTEDDLKSALASGYGAVTLMQNIQISLKTIVIDHPVTITSADHKILYSANNEFPAFEITSSDVTIENLIFQKNLGMQTGQIYIHGTDSAPITNIVISNTLIYLNIDGSGLAIENAEVALSGSTKIFANEGGGVNLLKNGKLHIGCDISSGLPNIWGDPGLFQEETYWQNENRFNFAGTDADICRQITVQNQFDWSATMTKNQYGLAVFYRAGEQGVSVDFGAGIQNLYKIKTGFEFYYGLPSGPVYDGYFYRA